MTDADPDMTMLAPSDASNPLRLLWLFARSAAVAGIVASALYAALYVAQDMRRSNTAPSGAAPAIQVPSGFELLTPLGDAHAFERVVGFAPVVPKTLPQGMSPAPRLDATQADASGARTGELRFTAQRDAGGAALGPSLLLTESKGHTAAIDPTLRVVADGTLGASLRCGSVRVDALVYAAPGAEPAQSSAAAQRFVDAFVGQCAR